MTPEVEIARAEWEEAYRRLLEDVRDPVRAEGLQLQLGVLMDELRKRIGGTYTLRELAAAYRDAEGWSREAIAERVAAPGWPRTLTLVAGAAFHLYARGAQDYGP